MASSKKETAPLRDVLENQIKELTENCESFLEANRIALDVLDELPLEDEEQHTLKARLGVIEDILDGACTRYTD